MSQWDADQAQWYADNWGVHPTHDIAVDALGLADDDVVVDVGCGSGHLVRLIAARVPRGRVVGVDPTEHMRHLADEDTDAHRDRIAYLAGRADALPLEDGEATAAVAVHSLHHWEDPVAGLREVARVLSPGGRLVLVEEDVDGRFGQGDGPLNVPDAVVALLDRLGWRDVTRVEASRDGAHAIVVQAIRPDTGGSGER